VHELIVDRVSGGFRQASADELARFRASRRNGPRRRREAARCAGLQSRPPSDFGFGGGAGLETGDLDCRRIGSHGGAVQPSTSSAAAGSSAAGSRPSPSFGPRPVGMSDSDDSDLDSFMRDVGVL